MRSASRIATAASIAFAVVSCTPEQATAPAQDIATATYATNLGITISAFTKTATGLYYLDTPVGGGVTAVSGNKVTVRYTGYFTNGSSFDSNNTGFPFTLGKGEVIAGWDEGVAGMKVGGTRKLIIPPSLGYGTNDYASIPGNSILVFTIQLISIP